MTRIRVFRWPLLIQSRSPSHTPKHAQQKMLTRIETGQKTKACRDSGNRTRTRIAANERPMNGMCNHLRRKWTREPMVQKKERVAPPRKPPTMLKDITRLLGSGGRDTSAGKPEGEWDQICRTCQNKSRFDQERENDHIENIVPQRAARQRLDFRNDSRYPGNMKDNGVPIVSSGGCHPKTTRPRKMAIGTQGLHWSRANHWL